jgi:glycosidase
MAARAVLALALSALAASAAAPEVLKVEPPGWWAGHSVNPVRVLIRGKNLTGVHVTAGDGLRAGPVQVNASGTYAFVDLTIANDAAPGPRTLQIGEAAAPFEILAPLPRGGRFQGFSPADVFYLIMPDRFANGDPSNDDPPVSKGLHNRADPRFYHGGDLEGIIQRLPYLKDLGVTTLWLTPVYDNANVVTERRRKFTDYHGYGPVDFYGVDEHLGDIAKLRELTDRAHAAGLKIVLDQVANHTGPFHPWAQDPPTPAWFHGTPERHIAGSSAIWTLADPHASPELRRATLEGWFVDLLPDLNQEDAETARYLIQNTLWWIGMTGVDGIRQDTVPYVPRGFWSQWMAAIKREYPQLKVVGEVFDRDAPLVSYFQGGVARDGVDTGIDALFDFPLYFALREAFAGKRPLRTLAMALGRDRLYPDPSMLVTFAGLHDVVRFASEDGATLDSLKLAFTFLLTTRGVPLLYYGDEIGMAGAGDPDNRRDFPGGWSEDARSAFEATGRTGPENEVWNHVRSLLHERSRSPALRGGRLIQLAADGEFLAYARVAEGETVLVAINNGDTLIERELGDTLPRISLRPRSAEVRRIK